MADNTINLLPGLSQEEVKNIEKKTKLNFSGVLFVFLVVFFSLVILGLNLWVRIDYNATNQKLKNTEGAIRNLSYVETHQKTLENKISTYSTVKESEFSADEILKYLKDTAGNLANVDGLYLDSKLKFELRGSAASFTNVARIWHEMSRDKEYFDNIYLEEVSRSGVADGKGMQTGVRFVFTGVVKQKEIKANI